MDRAKKLKSIVKHSTKESFGTNPRDPWSAKANIDEDAALDKYLLSRGINPKFATKDQKVAHSKTGQFIKWKQDHMMEDRTTTHTPVGQKLHSLKKSVHVGKEVRVPGSHKQLHQHNESVDKKDTVTMDIPLLIRVLELAREDIKSDMDLHRVVEKLINIRNKGMLTMKDYNYIAKIHEEIMPQISAEQLDEISKETMHSYATKAHAKYDVLRHKKDPESMAKKKKLAAGIKKISARERPPVQHKPEPRVDMSSPEAYYKTAKGRYMGDSVEHDDTPMVEAKMSAAAKLQKALENQRKRREAIQQYTSQNILKKPEPKAEPQKEDIFQDPKAATQTVFDGGTTTNDTIKSARSKSARIIKSIYKKKQMVEEIYDHEKEDKSVATYGKKPSVKETNSKSQGDNPNKAAIIMKGGRTLTGTDRDTVEIDPEMKRPKTGDGGPQDTKTINK